MVAKIRQNLSSIIVISKYEGNVKGSVKDA